MDELVRSEHERRLERRQRFARMRINRGIVMLVMVPVVMVGAIMVALMMQTLTVATAVLVLAAVYGLIGGFGGAGLLLVGSAEHRQVSRELRELTEPRQLPTARLIVR